MLLVGCIVDIALVPVCMCSSMVGVGTSVAVGDVCCSAFCCWHCWSCCGGVMVVVIAVVDVTVVMDCTAVGISVVAIVVIDGNVDVDVRAGVIVVFLWLLVLLLLLVWLHCAASVVGSAVRGVVVVMVGVRVA